MTVEMSVEVSVTMFVVVAGVVIDVTVAEAVIVDVLYESQCMSRKTKGHPQNDSHRGGSGRL